MRTDRLKIALALGAVALAGAAVWRVGRSLPNTDPYGPPGSTGTLIGDFVKGARQINARPGDFLPALGVVAEQLVLDPIKGIYQNAASGVMNMTGAPRGLRNNNPGNIREVGINWQGKIGDDGAFTRFESMFYGARALVRNMWSIVGRTDGTLQTLISTWAPAHENNTDAYISFVSRETGISPGSVVNRGNVSEMGRIAMAIAIMENGESAVRQYAPELLTANFWAMAADAAGIAGGKTS